MARPKSAKAISYPRRADIIQFISETGMATLGQIAKALGLSWGSARWHLRVGEGGLCYYSVGGRHDLLQAL
ncbi:winged helix-turn-helix domain-containing protein [Thermoproteus tenax]|uniref:Transcriptional regulator containing HTH domain, ArsR family n=1 Tax=Thermoproteus tenax (strain ATCC 35583 / DSM 2078 / JCM 9277 / NBRC 100435 / Kra 1) TaxID=768679 RepID=G4RNM8_THETK|nr:helix-turn-helix transcriptional regulator [Thermoproteus tenax]CCC81172.1 Transcriptional regulator containing HTH domain, ArsR family [Thermoproteus tenax Kra 1]